MSFVKKAENPVNITANFNSDFKKACRIIYVLKIFLRNNESGRNNLSVQLNFFFTSGFNGAKKSR